MIHLRYINSRSSAGLILTKPRAVWLRAQKKKLRLGHIGHNGSTYRPRHRLPVVHSSLTFSGDLIDLMNVVYTWIQWVLIDGGPCSTNLVSPFALPLLD